MIMDAVRLSSHDTISLFVGSHGNYTEDHARRAAKWKSTVSMQTIFMICTYSTIGHCNLLEPTCAGLLHRPLIQESEFSKHVLR